MLVGTNATTFNNFSNCANNLISNRVFAFKNVNNVNDSVSFCGKKEVQDTTNAAPSLWQSLKTVLIVDANLSLLPINTYKMLLKDPCAMMYGTMKRDSNAYLISSETLGEVALSIRGSKNKHKSKVVKYVFNDGDSRYCIKRFGERLGYIDISHLDENDIYIKYLTNVVGRDKYRGLEKILLQSVVEDSLNNGTVPSFSAVPAQIGELDFKRDKLYAFMGADVVTLLVIENGKIMRDSNGDMVTFSHVIYSKEKVLEKLERINEKDAFMFPKTKTSYANFVKGSRYF